ncbi:MAG: histidinol-phosphate aminotransferase family protein [Chloroflexi bacterium]|nr:histidinol-phosphate aminotransferase family protein [Chloroflexota bacterium]
MPLRPNPEVENLEACPHGGPNWAELTSLGLNPDEVLDFSVSTNPFMPPPGIKEIYNTIAIDHYPDSEATELRQCLSEKLEVAPVNILAGSGATELIRLIPLTYFGHGDSVLILQPTFGEYKVACQIMGSDVFEHWGRAEENFAPRIEEIVSLIRRRRPKGIFICNPGNPTGQYLSRKDIEMILNACGDCLLVIDEAYIAFTDGSWPSTDLIPQNNLIILRSMTKDYALAGLRLGYIIANREIIDTLQRVRLPWNVNVVAQKAGVIALKDTQYLKRCELKIRQAKQFLIDELGRIGFTLVPSRTNFFLVKVGDGKSFRSALLRRGIMVRDCASFGLSEYVRIAPRTMPECQKLISTIEALKREGRLDVSI